MVDRLRAELEEMILALVVKHPKITLAQVIKICNLSFPAEEVRAAVNVLADKNKVKIKGKFETMQSTGEVVLTIVISPADPPP